MPIESRGRKDPALAAAIKAGKPPETTQWEYVVGRRALKVGEETRQPGEAIPEAAEWPRLESWIRSGAIVQRTPTARTVSAPAKKAPARPAPKAVEQDEAPRRSVLRPYREASA